MANQTLHYQNTIYMYNNAIMLLIINKHFYIYQTHLFDNFGFLTVIFKIVLEVIYYIICTCPEIIFDGYSVIKITIIVRVSRWQSHYIKTRHSLPLPDYIAINNFPFPSKKLKSVTNQY